MISLLKVNYCLHIAIVSLAICFIFYSNYHCKNTIFISKIICCISITLQILLKFSLNQNLIYTTPFTKNASDKELRAKANPSKVSENYSTESSFNIRSKNKNKTKVLSLLYIIFQCVASIAVIHITIILFGAHVFHHFDETFSLSFLLATLTTIRPLILFGSAALPTCVEDWCWSNPCQIQGIFVALGAWLGAFTIPLDWDTPWQNWPIPCVIGTLVGEFTSTSLLLLQDLRKPKKLV